MRMNHRLFQVLTRPPVKRKELVSDEPWLCATWEPSEHPAVEEWSSRQARQTDEQADNEGISINNSISHHPPNTAFPPDPVLCASSLYKIWPSVTPLIVQILATDLTAKQRLKSSTVQSFLYLKKLIQLTNATA